MKKIFRLSSIAILATAFMAVKCGEEAVEPPASVTTAYSVSVETAINPDSTKYLDLVVEIDSVYFIDTAGTLFNGTNSNANGTRVISDCDGNTLDVFTSTDREFSFEPIAEGMGPIRGILSEFNGNRQLLLRSLDDVADMTGEKCSVQYTSASLASVLADQFSEGDVVAIQDVEFVDPSGTWGGVSDIQDCNGNTLPCYVSSSAAFANDFKPTGNGALVGELAIFNQEWEIIPFAADAGDAMTGPLCDGGGGGGGGGNDDCTSTPTTTFESKDFNDLSVTSGGWTTQVVVGTTDWGANDFGGDQFAKISNFSSGNSAAEAWLISPAININSASAPAISFETIAKFDGDQLKLMVSTDYSGSGAPSAATWTDLTSAATWDADMSDWGDWVCSGNVDLSGQKSTATYVAFKYTGSDSDGTTWEVDDILIKE